MGGSKILPSPEKTCDLCKQSSGIDGEDIIFFGEWMTRSDITVHYYCLLLSTNLPQRGEDHGGILGFLLRDIRKEINFAKQRSCTYCGKKSASIMCCVCSKAYFHLICGHTNKCLYQFVDEFKSYCSNCLPLDEEQKRLSAKPPDPVSNKCFICMDSMGIYYPYSWIKAECCKNGYVHSVCMKKYALTAGYYLKCIWCKNKKFREDIKYYGIFVPDRDANWERDKAYRDLNRNPRCDMDICHCANGREYKKGNKWKIIICKLCGLMGAHNPTCIPGMEHSKQRILEFKCDTCSVTEHTIRDMANESRSDEVLGEDINVTLYVNKGVNNNSTVCSYTDAPEFSDSSMSSVDTVINKALLKYTPNTFTTPQQAGQVVMPILTQCAEEEPAPLDENKTRKVIASCTSIVSLPPPVANSFKQTEVLEGKINSMNDLRLTQCDDTVLAASPVEIGQNCLTSTSVSLHQTPGINSEFMAPNQKLVSTEKRNDDISEAVTVDTAADRVVEDSQASDDEDLPDIEAINMAVDRLLDLFDV